MSVFSYEKRAFFLGHPVHVIRLDPQFPYISHDSGPLPGEVVRPALLIDAPVIVRVLVAVRGEVEHSGQHHEAVHAGAEVVLAVVAHLVALSHSQVRCPGHGGGDHRQTMEVVGLLQER